MASSHACTVPRGLPQPPVPIAKATNIPRCSGILGYLFCKNKQTHTVFAAFSKNGDTCQSACCCFLTMPQCLFFYPYLPPNTQGLFELLLLSLHLPIIEVLKPYRPESNPTCADYSLGDFNKVNFFVDLNLQISKMGLFMYTHFTRLVGVGW